MAETTPQSAEMDDVARYSVDGAPGDVIYTEGDSGSDMFIIIEGGVEISRSFAGQSHSMGVLEQGDFFGEMSLLEGLPREATATATAACKLLRIDHSVFEQIIHENPEIAVRMMQKLSGRLRDRLEAEKRAAEIAQGAMRMKQERDAAKAAKEEAADVPTPPPPAPEPPKPPAPEAKKPATPAAAFLVHSDSNTEFDLLTDGETTIGRPDRAAGFNPSVDLTKQDTQRSLSRRHAKIVIQDGNYVVRPEVAARNGTFINGERVDSESSTALSEGDEIRFGLVRTVFHYR